LLSELTTQLPVVPLSEPASREALLAALGESVAFATTKLAEWGDAGLAAEWRLVDGDATLMVVPRGEMVRTLMLNHTYHHRGQLMVYLRLLGIPLPPVYGPTADENPFA
jgi:uncharacterized damage-inducible protein DinB